VATGPLLAPRDNGDCLLTHASNLRTLAEAEISAAVALIDPEETFIPGFGPR